MTSRWNVAIGLACVLLAPGAGIARPSSPPHAGKDSAVPVRIEILPGVREKWIDPVLAEPVPVALLGGPTMDVRDIDPETLVLSSAAVGKNEDGSLASYRDVDGDGITDLVVSFPSRSIRLGRGTRAWLSGSTLDGRALLASAPLSSVPNERRARRARAVLDAERLPPMAVRIDLLPSDADNLLELGNRGTVEVAVLGARDLDVTRIDPLSLRLAGSPVTRRRGGGLASVQDVDGDGYPDLVIEVPRALLRLAPGAKEVVLAGRTPEGRLLMGRDHVSIAEIASLTFDSEDPAVGLEPEGVEFANGQNIAIPASGAAVPYPSQIIVSGLTGVISKVRVTLKRLSHAAPADIDILLVGPTGQSILLLSDLGGGGAVSNLNLTFDDDGLELDPLDPLASGTFAPGNVGGSDVFPAPAPAVGPSELQPFAGTNPNGTWSLYVVDDTANGSGSIAGGWALDFVMAQEFCNAGPIAINDNVPATPYPSAIAVSGVPGVVTKVTAALKGFSHAFPGDVDILLVSPTGQTGLVISDVGTGNISGITLVLDDNALFSLDPTTFPSNGTYRPSDAAPSDTFVAPAPAGPYPVSLGGFQGIDPNGTWNVYVRDDALGDTGSLASVCLRITSMTPVDGANLAAVTIPAGAPGTTSGPASAYPSTIDVSGVIGTLKKATVTLRGVTHTFPRDMDVLLRGPGGANVLLMSDVGGGAPGVAGINLTFDDEAAGLVPTNSNPFNGTYKPSNDDSGGADALPAPAPAGPYGATLSGLAGASPNGSWGLFVYDDSGGDVGSLASGWSLTLRTWLPTYSTCSSTPITIPGGAPAVTQGTASPYPSTSVLNPLPVDMDQYKLKVNLVGLTHSFPQDMDMLLVGPQGQNVILMSDGGGTSPVSNLNLSFDDDASAIIPQATTPVAGTYRPFNHSGSDTFPAPAPGGIYGSSLSVFKGTNPLGIWSLYIVDDAIGDTGGLGQWCLNFLPSIDAEEVQNLRFTDKTTANWDAGPNAVSYLMYRGTPSQLQQLDDASPDGCLRGPSQVLQFTPLSEVPSVGSFFWYLVRGSNAQGDGSVGFQNLGGQIRARVLNSSGSCP